MAKADYQLLADFFEDPDHPVLVKRRTLKVRLQEMAMRNKGMLERDTRMPKMWCLWLPDGPDGGDHLEPTLKEMQSVMHMLWPHEFSD